jgi:hypothetical protein
MTCENFDFRLTIDSAQYAGTISCRATNDAGSIDTSAKLIVITPSKPEFTKRLQDIQATEGEPFSAEVACSNAANFKWFINGKPVQVSVPLNFFI